MLYIQDRKTLKLIPASEYKKHECNAPAILPDIEGYVSPATGLWVDGRKQKRADLKASGCRDWEGMDQEKKECARQRAYEDEKTDKFVFSIAEQQFMKLNEQQRRALAR